MPRSFRRVLAALGIGLVALQPGVSQPLSQAQAPDRQYLPLVLLRDPAPQSALAALWQKGFDGRSVAAARAQASGAGRVRTFIEWRGVEPVQTDPPSYDWSLYDAELAAIRQRGLEPMVNLTDAPDWAAFPNCGPFRDANGLARWVEFVKAAVGRYSAPPYSARYFLLTNEPDFRMKDPFDRNGGGWGGGCWGNNPVAFGEMLRATYSAVKPLYPNVFLVMGPLAADGSSSDFNLNFFQEVVSPLLGNAANAFDLAAFNYFIFYRQNWEQYGPSVVGKAERFRQILAGLGTRKPILVAETGVVDGTDDHQANLVPQVYTQALADAGRATGDGIHVLVWFTLKDYVGSSGVERWGLLDLNDAPKPAYFAYRQWVNELAGATLKANQSEPTYGTTPPLGARKCNPTASGSTAFCDTLQQYLFRTPSSTDKLVVWVDPGAKGGSLYYTTPATRLLQLPASDVLAVRDRAGQPKSFPVVGGQLQVLVTESPLYLDVVRR
ncbi:MAG: hypothetical protein K6U89_01435 [Chloroflexi bacterium]|nr:hypothetical protein [Chloroflexota bacterium]